MSWIQYAKFLSENASTASNPWSGHRSFAYDLVRFMKPGIFVELGTHSGTSFFSFCQAVKDGSLGTKCFAIDTWKGDPHAGEYGEYVYQYVSEYAEQEFLETAFLIRSKFDEALVHFAGESVDLLHIDGYHTYDAVSHDFLTWLPKLAPNGIVLFHDIKIMSGDFGVYRLWGELKSVFPHMEFDHSYGLGVLFPKGHTEAFSEIIAQKEKFKSLYSG
ncbi:class I SAM-dependent methyltransferase [Paenibacillus alkaliterrae]|uniref:class I SAM-dependent methyltransferase n=1 Tax=Paenibacillus alkaliterrae TaxID=320909 RepID=UPI001F1DFF48|nr:class I SAM-dependent methyltransferase [Paenibacillus alkaliterrae]MCF2941364.1 class I SAM-dependent methyltransferase [Paenibacillus alkaliterrae]